MASTPTTRARTPHYLAITGTTHAELKLRSSSFSGPLKTALGIVETEPTNSTAIATSRESAMERGIFYLTVEYRISAGKTQTAKVPVAPAKADTAFVEVLGKKYNNKDIVAVRVPRRRVFVI